MLFKGCATPITGTVAEASKSKTIGRPSKYTPEVVEEICRRLEEGESLRHIGMLDHMPTAETIRTWLRDKPDFSAQYARARELQADFFADEIRDIANDGRNDWEVRESERTGQERIILNAEAVQRSRLRVDTLKWLMAKQAPKKYGEKIEVENTGNQGIGLVVTPEVLEQLQKGYKELKESFK
jgi:hypothetical protein